MNRNRPSPNHCSEPELCFLFAHVDSFVDDFGLPAAGVIRSGR
jgi:hypothetical protein